MKLIPYSLIVLFTLSLPAQVYSAQGKSVFADDKVLFDQAVLMSKDGDWINAEKIFRDVAQRNPGWPEPKNNRAIALYNMGKLEQARQALDEAVTSLPSFKVAQENRQHLYDYAATIAYYKVVSIQEEPESPKLVLLTDVSSVSNSKNQHTQAMPVRQPGPIDEIEQEVRIAVLDWARAWSAADVKSYFDSYSTSFQPSVENQSYNYWRNERTVKLKFGNIEKVSVNAIDVFLDTAKQSAVAQFEQGFWSKTYKDKVIKQLQLVYENNRWLIRSEIELKKLQ